jgi:hypothetical protein
MKKENRRAPGLSDVAWAVMFARAGWSSSPIHIPTLKAASRLINDRVARYLGQYQPELFVDFQKIADWKVDVCSFPKHSLAVSSSLGRPCVATVFCRTGGERSRINVSGL